MVLRLSSKCIYDQGKLSSHINNKMWILCILSILELNIKHNNYINDHYTQSNDNIRCCRTFSMSTTYTCLHTGVILSFIVMQTTDTCVCVLLRRTKNTTVKRKQQAAFTEMNEIHYPKAQNLSCFSTKNARFHTIILSTWSILIISSCITGTSSLVPFGVVLFPGIIDSSIITRLWALLQ